MTRLRRRTPLGVGLALPLLALASMLIGAGQVELRDGLAFLWGDGAARADERLQTVMWSLRLPRLLAAVLVGGALGAAGVLMQAVTRNPLAEPGLLGVNAGAALGVLGMPGLTAWVGLKLVDVKAGGTIRTVRSEGVDYAWDEYLLFNPTRGYRYLIEYRGHWNDAVVAHDVPTVTQGQHPMAHFRGQYFKHFQTATAETTFVLGEFPWEVRVGDKALAHDYVSPPLMLTAEETSGEKSESPLMITNVSTCALV